MVLDHIALFLPGMPLYLRWIGRISMPLFLFVFVHSIDNTKDRKAFAGRLYIFNALMAFLDLAYNIMPIPSERYYGIFVRLDTNIFGTFFCAIRPHPSNKENYSAQRPLEKNFGGLHFLAGRHCGFLHLCIHPAWRCVLFILCSNQRKYFFQRRPLFCNSVGNCPIFFQKPKMEMCILVFRSGIGKFRYYLKPNHSENLHASFIQLIGRFYLLPYFRDAWVRRPAVWTAKLPDKRIWVDGNVCIAPFPALWRFQRQAA